MIDLRTTLTIHLNICFIRNLLGYRSDTWHTYTGFCSFQWRSRKLMGLQLPPRYSAPGTAGLK